MDQVQKKLLCATPGQDFSVWSDSVWSDSVWAVSVWAVTVTGHFGMAVSVRGHFGHDISVHKQLITFVHLNVYRQAKCHASCCYTNSFEGSWLRWNLNCNYDFEEFGFTSKCRCWFNLLAHDNENHMLMLINCWILDHVCNFSNKISSWFKYICINIGTGKISARFHCLTEMSPDRNGPDRNGSDRIGKTKKSPTRVAQHLIAPYKDDTAYLHIG